MATGEEEATHPVPPWPDSPASVSLKYTSPTLPMQHVVQMNSVVANLEELNCKIDGVLNHITMVDSAWKMRLNSIAEKLESIGEMEVRHHISLMLDSRYPVNSSTTPALPSPLLVSPECIPPQRMPSSTTALADITNIFHIPQVIVSTAMVTCRSRKNLAGRLVVSLFTDQEKMSSNVRGVLGKKVLDPDRIAAIQKVCLSEYPLQSGETLDSVRKELRISIDEVCRRKKTS